MTTRVMFSLLFQVRVTRITNSSITVIYIYMYIIWASKSCRSHDTVLGQVVLPKAQDLKNVRVRNISGARLSYLRGHLTAGVGSGAVSCRCLSRMRSALATAHDRCRPVTLLLNTATDSWPDLHQRPFLTSFVISVTISTMCLPQSADLERQIFKATLTPTAVPESKSFFANVLCRIGPISLLSLVWMHFFICFPIFVSFVVS